MIVLERLVAWFVTSPVGRAIAAGLAIAATILVAVLKVFNAGKASERQRQELEGLREANDALTEQKEIRDESRSMPDDDLDRDNSRWLRP